MRNIVVLISGSGSNLQAIIDACHEGRIHGRVCGVISNRPDAYGLERARRAGIPDIVVDHRLHADRTSFESELTRQLERLEPDLILLAGFMRILTPDFVARFEGRMLNIHPSLLPKYRGLHTHRQALANGDREHGSSVHFVTAELDGGPVVAQEKLTVEAGDTEATLADRVKILEHRLYPQVVDWFCSGRLQYRNGKIQLDPPEAETSVSCD